MPRKIWFFSMLSGLLLGLPWYPVWPGLFLGFALLPLLYVEDYLLQRKQHFPMHTAFLHFTLTFFVWQFLSFWWISNVTIIGALFLITLNSFCYAGFFALSHYIGRQQGRSFGRLSLLVFWITFEFISLRIDFGVPWLILGNGLFKHTQLIQWYEYTGVLGGSLWILGVNFLVADMVLQFRKIHPRIYVFKAAFTLALLISPVMCSLNLYKKAVPEGKHINVALIQPNIDPFTEKFEKISQEEQLAIILGLADSVSHCPIDLYVAPETAIDNQIWEDNLRNNYSIFAIDEFVHNNPHTAFIIGAITYKELPESGKLPATARFNAQDSLYYEAFNSALYVDTSTHIPIYHKSKLVLGIEKAPLIGLFKFLKKFTIQLGGPEGSFGQQATPTLLGDSTKGIQTASVICYESVFGAHVNQFINKGANIIVILTNDGWWGGTPAYSQHFDYARIRAIETRRWVVRSANTGISGIIDSRGNVVSRTQWWQRTVLSGKVALNDIQTFYVKHGDYIGRVAAFLSVCILMILVSMRIRKGKV
ncbi:MAG TPA: apolipoprotein N-acyltransferase [Bacteroidales bacterium]|nr:apolipoprotein N-acyltransferase [Bacteroidales bacterium]